MLGRVVFISKRDSRVTDCSGALDQMNGDTGAPMSSAQSGSDSF